MSVHLVAEVYYLQLKRIKILEEAAFLNWLPMHLATVEVQQKLVCSKLRVEEEVLRRRLT